MRRKTLLTLIAASTFTVAGCTPYQRQNEQAGMVIGRLLGGVLGSQVEGGSGRTAAIIAGTLIRPHLGSPVGSTMDEEDRRDTAQSLLTVRPCVPSPLLH